jgi:hypothetical protein
MSGPDLSAALDRIAIAGFDSPYGVSKCLFQNALADSPEHEPGRKPGDPMRERSNELPSVLASKARLDPAGLTFRSMMRFALTVDGSGQYWHS